MRRGTVAVDGGSRVSRGRTFATLAVALALVGCADGRFEERAGEGHGESTDKVAQAWTSVSLKDALARFEGSPPAECDYAHLCDGQGCSMGTPGDKNVMYVTGDVTFPSNRCTFMGQIRIEAPDVELDCNGSVIDGRQLDSHGIRNGNPQAALKEFHDGCDGASPPVKNVTVRDCVVKHAGQEGIAFGRKYGQEKVNDDCVDIDPVAYFGPVNDEGYHEPGNYWLPEYLVNELSADTRRLLRNKMSDASVLKVLHELGPQNIVLENVTLAFNQRLQLYVREYTTDFTIRSSLLVQSPHGMPLHCPEGESCEPGTFDCADTRAKEWHCVLLDAGSPEQFLCDALERACDERLTDDENEAKRSRKFTVYVDRESRDGSFVEVDFRRDMADVPEASRDTDGKRYPTHIALDSTKGNSIVNSRFFGAANGIMSFKNCGERDRYRYQDSANNTISGNVFVLAEEATAVWLGSRQGGRYQESETSPFNCFLEGEEYPWLVLPPFESRGTLLDEAEYESLVASNYCRQELPEMVDSEALCDGCETPMFFDFSTNNDVTGNWFIRKPGSMPSVISWERREQTANVISGNFANVTHPQGTHPTLRTVCKRNGFSALLGQEETGSGGVTQKPAPVDVLRSAVPELLRELRELGGSL